MAAPPTEDGWVALTEQELAELREEVTRERILRLWLSHVPCSVIHRRLGIDRRKVNKVVRDYLRGRVQ